MARPAYESVDRALAERAAADREAAAEADRPDWRSEEWRAAEPELRAAWRALEERWTKAEAAPGVERADRPHETRDPSIVGDNYPTISPNVPDRYLERDQANPIPVFDGQPSRDQVKQGQVGDCGVISTMGAVAEHRPDAIRNAIKQTGDGRYEITLHDVIQATSNDPVARPTGHTTTYKLTDELPVATNDPQRPPVGAQAERCGWSALLEKTVAAEDQTWDTKQKSEWQNEWTTRHKPMVDRERWWDYGLSPSPHDAPTGYNRLDIGSTAYQRADLLANLTGEEAEVREIPDEQRGEQALFVAFRDRVDNDKPVLVGTRGAFAGELFPDGVEPGHAYEVTKVEGDRVHLHNPWGDQYNPGPLSAKDFWEYFRWYNPDGSRTGHYTTLT